MSPRGVPIMLKCPKCSSTLRQRAENADLEATGRTDGREWRSREAANYHALRVEMRCRNCGHEWWSVHPDAERYLNSLRDPDREENDE